MQVGRDVIRLVELRYIYMINYARFLFTKSKLKLIIDMHVPITNHQIMPSSTRFFFKFLRDTIVTLTR